MNASETPNGYNIQKTTYASQSKAAISIKYKAVLDSYLTCS